MLLHPSSGRPCPSPQTLTALGCHPPPLPRRHAVPVRQSAPVFFTLEMCCFGVLVRFRPHNCYLLRPFACEMLLASLPGPPMHLSSPPAPLQIFTAPVSLTTQCTLQNTLSSAFWSHQNGLQPSTRANINFHQFNL